MINFIFIFDFDLISPFGSLINIKGINDIVVIIITRIKPSRYPSTNPLFLICESTYLETKYPDADPVVKLMEKKIDLYLYKTLDTRSK